ncbi:MAG: TonB family protein [Alphaproteobacteria bacterium]
MSGVTGRQLAAAAAIATALHAGFAISVLWAPPPDGAKAMGLGGVEVSLGPAGGAPGDTANPVAETPETPVVEPEEARVESPPETVIEPAPPEPVAESVDVAPAPPVAIAEVRAIAPPPRPQQKPKPPEPPRRAPPAVEAVSAPEAVAAAEPVREQRARETPSVAGAAGKSGIQDRPDAGDADSTAGGGTPGASADYMSYLLAWLQKHKEYPRLARRHRQQGTALMYFEMDRDGRIHTAALRQSSGHAALDDEARALIRRAEPLPPPPPEVAGDRIRLVVPVQFYLR